LPKSFISVINSKVLKDTGIRKAYMSDKLLIELEMLNHQFFICILI